MSWLGMLLIWIYYDIIRTTPESQVNEEGDNVDVCLDEIDVLYIDMYNGSILVCTKIPTFYLLLN